VGGHLVSCLLHILEVSPVYSVVDVLLNMSSSVCCSYVV
jgi:hypothetical protein